MADEITAKEEVVTEALIEPFNESQDILPVQAPEQQTLNSTVESSATAQIPVNEPFGNTQDKPFKFLLTVLIVYASINKNKI